MVLALNQERAIKAARRLADRLPVRTHKVVVPADFEDSNIPIPCTINGRRFLSLRHARQELGMSAERIYRILEQDRRQSRQTPTERP